MSVCVSWEENDAACENDYRAVTLSLALLFFCPGVTLYLYMLWDVCVCAFSIQVFAAMLVLVFNIFVCICSLRPQAFFPTVKIRDYSQRVWRYEVMLSLSYLRSDLRTVSFTPTSTHWLYIPTHCWQGFSELMLSLSGKPLSINLSTVHWLARHKSCRHNFSAPQTRKSVMFGKVITQQHAFAPLFHEPIYLLIL